MAILGALRALGTPYCTQVLCPENLCPLDGETFFVEGNFWVTFEAKQVPATSEKPRGLDYSLTLHDGDGERLLGFDNAHPIREGTGPGARTRIEYDHKHKGERVRSMTTKMRSPC